MSLATRVKEAFESASALLDHEHARLDRARTLADAAATIADRGESELAFDVLRIAGEIHPAFRALTID